MKTTAIILTLFISIGFANAQSEEKVEAKPTKPINKAYSIL
jgi:hypothetical protein